jgi:hypothetical protein
LADTVTPPSFSPDVDAIAPLSTWSAALADDAATMAAAEVRKTLASVGIVVPR